MYNLFKTIVISIIALSCVNFAYAENVLTWQECVSISLENHPDLISAAEKVTQAKADHTIEISGALPSVSSSASGKRSKSATGKTHNTYAYDISGQQIVFDGFKTSSDVSNAFKTYQAEKYNYDVTSSNIRLNLRNAFVGLLEAQELVSLTSQIAVRRKQNLEMIKLRYEAGREHKGSLLTAQADLAQAEFEVAQAKRNISLAQAELLKELGIEKIRNLRINGEFSVVVAYSTKPDVDELAKTTPFLRELIAKKEAARYSLQSTESDFFPDVYLNASLDRSGSGILPRGKAWSAGMSASFPLFEGGSRVAEISKAKSQFNQAKADERSGLDSVIVTLETTWKDLLDSVEKVEVRRKFLEADEERAKIAGAQYEKGLISFDDWVIIENNLVSSRKSYLEARAGMLLSEAYWIQAIGGTLDYDEK